MNIALLSRNPKLYSTRRLVEAAEQRGHSIRTLDVLRCYMNMACNSPEIHYGGEKLPNFDAVIPRIGASVTFYGTAVLPQVQALLASGRRRPAELFQQVVTRRVTADELIDVDPELQSLANLNTPEDYEAALRDARV